MGDPGATPCLVKIAVLLRMVRAMQRSEALDLFPVGAFGEVLREPAQIRRCERAHCRRADLGEPVRRGLQTLPRPCRAACRPRDGHVDASRCARITSSTNSSPRCSSASVSSGRFVGGSPTSSRTHDAQTSIAIVAPAVCGPNCLSWSPSSDHL